LQHTTAAAAASLVPVDSAQLRRSTRRRRRRWSSGAGGDVNRHLAAVPIHEPLLAGDAEGRSHRPYSTAVQSAVGSGVESVVAPTDDHSNRTTVSSTNPTAVVAQSR